VSGIAKRYVGLAMVNAEWVIVLCMERKQQSQGLGSEGRRTQLVRPA